MAKLLTKKPKAKKEKKPKVKNNTVVYFFVNSKRKIECRNCKQPVWLDDVEANRNGVDIDVRAGTFVTGSMSEFEQHVKAHKSRKDKVYASNLKEVKRFFKKLA